MLLAALSTPRKVYLVIITVGIFFFCGIFSHWATLIGEYFYSARSVFMLWAILSPSDFPQGSVTRSSSIFLSFFFCSLNAFPYIHCKIHTRTWREHYTLCFLTLQILLFSSFTLSNVLFSLLSTLNHTDFTAPCCWGSIYNDWSRLPVWMLPTDSNASGNYSQS